MTLNRSKQRTVEAFKDASSLHPLVVGHMCKQDKNSYTFSKRYFALYEGGLLVYYTHQRDFEEDVKKHQGLPLHCTLIKLDGMYLTRPKFPPHGMKHYFTLHAPENSNHREEFLLVCQRKMDMRIWVEQLQSQNTQLAGEDAKLHKTPTYIMKLRLQTLDSGCSLPKSLEYISKPDSNWLKRTSTYSPGEIALAFHTSIDEDS